MISALRRGMAAEPLSRNHLEEAREPTASWSERIDSELRFHRSWKTEYGLQLEG